MKKQPTMETKLANWTSAFNSISNKQSIEAQILGGLVTGLKSRISGRDMAFVSVVA